LYSGSTPLVGWFIAGFGFMFALIIAGLMGLDDTIPRNWIHAGKATITNIEEANVKLNGEEIYAYHFESADRNISGISYGYSGKYETGDEASLLKAEKRYRIENLTLTTMGEGWFDSVIFLGMGCLIGLIGISFLIYSWFAGGKAIRFLQEGEAAKARFLGMNPTGTLINKKPVMKANFEYQVEGSMYTASATALDTSRLTDAPCEVVFYDPMQPDKSIVMDGLPRGIYFDELMGQFGANPLHCVFPFLAAAVVCCEIAAIVLFVVRAI